MKKRIKAVLSDAGGILFDYSVEDTQLKPLKILLERNGKNLSIDEIFSLYLPYLFKAQTTISEEETINQFLCDNCCTEKFSDYKIIRNSITSSKKKVLIKGVTEALENLRDMQVDFYILTNAKKPSAELQEGLNKMLIEQLQEIGVYNPRTFNPSNYVKAMISSKDLGIRMPKASFFDAVLSFDRKIPLKRSEVVFVAHSSHGIFGAADLGISVIAFNYQKENDAKSIIKRIGEYNKQSNSKIYTIENFIEIPSIVAKLNI